VRGQARGVARVATGQDQGQGRELGLGRAMLALHGKKAVSRPSHPHACPFSIQYNTVDMTLPIHIRSLLPFPHHTEKKFSFCVRDMTTVYCMLEQCQLNKSNLPEQLASQRTSHNNQCRTYLVGDVQRVVVRRQPHICFLLSIRSAQQHHYLSEKSNFTSQYTNRISVFTFAACTSHNFFTASLIWRLFALMSTRNTSVLCSSIFFIADSVFSGLRSREASTSIQP
jgi:hypothetical protein